MAFSPPNAQRAQIIIIPKVIPQHIVAMQPAKEHIPCEPTTAKLTSNTLSKEQDKESTPRGTHLQTTDNRHSIPTPSIGYRIRTIHASISSNTFISGSANPQQITNRPIKKAEVIITTNSNQILSPRALVIARATTDLQIAYHEQHPKPFEVNVVQSLSITNWHARV